MFKRKHNIHPAIVGLLQTVGVTLYCSLISFFFVSMDKIQTDAPSVIGLLLILFIFVFSAAVCGLLVFGYPLFLAFNKKLKEALCTVGYTILFSSFVILVVLMSIIATY